MSLRDRCVDKIGAGQNRRVYLHPDDPGLVVKIAKNPETHTWRGPEENGRPYRKQSDFANSMEWRIWERVRGTDLEQWFVPCVSLSPDLMELVQRRADEAAGVPADYPDWLIDSKLANWGVFESRVRRLDYADRRILVAVDALLR